MHPYPMGPGSLDQRGSDNPTAILPSGVRRRTDIQPELGMEAAVDEGTGAGA